MSENRQAFERFISSPPFEKDIKRFPTGDAKYSYPGAYCDITVELAWECWREATSMQIARFESQLAEAEVKIPRWIPVSERLPKPHNAVLAVRKNCTGRPYYATMYRDEKWSDIVSTEVIDVTHWMPLPEAPEIEKGSDARLESL